MNKRKLLPLAISAMFAVVSFNSLAQSDPADSFARFDEAGDQFGFIDNYCIGCHNYEDWAGSLAFDTLTPNDVAANIDIWEHAVTKLRGRFMPPANEPNRPTNDRADEFVAWISEYLDHIESLEPYTGRVGLHRLNRKEYANAIRDLLGIEVDAVALLPVDSSVDGFDNVAEALRVSPTFLEQSLAAARVVATQAVGSPDSRTGGSTFNPSGTQQTVHRDGLPLGTRGGLAIDYYFPSDGEYVINVGNLASALWVSNQEFTHTLIATYDGERFFELDIAGGKDLKAIDQDGDPAVDAINSQLKNIPFTATAGPHEIVVTFIHRTFAESEGRLHALNAGAGGENAVSIRSVEIQGPFNPSGISATPARNKIFVCYPANQAEEATCARTILANTARKAFRGSITEPEVDRLVGVYEQVRDQDASFDIGIRRALSVILASPKFLYRLEPAPAGTAPGSAYALNDVQLATRLSFFLWSSIPDDELLNIAMAGKLSDKGEIEKQVLRMLGDPKAETLVSNFAYQWLNMSGLDEIVPDPAIFRGIDFGVRDLFKEEMNLFMASIFLENRSVTELLSAEYTYMNERLAQHYGDYSVKGDNFRRVELKDSIRYGLLGKGAVLMVSSYPDRTSPVLRGNYVLEYITGTPPPDPPPNVEALLENKEGTTQMTVRQRLEKHRDNPSCQGCHGIMDPLGFALENFDAVGRFRTEDLVIGAPIDTSGILPDGTPISGTDDLREALIAYPENFALFLTKQLMLYALGREVTEHDMPSVRSIVNQAAKDDYKFFDLVMGIVETNQFTQNLVPEAEHGVAEVASID